MATRKPSTRVTKPSQDAATDMPGSTTARARRSEGMPSAEMDGPPRTNGSSADEMSNGVAMMGAGGPEQDAGASGDDMPQGGMADTADEGGQRERVLVEIRVPSSLEGADARLSLAAGVDVPGFELDSGFAPVPVSAHAEQAANLAASSEEVVIVRGTVAPDERAALESQPNVIKVWDDTPIAPFAAPPMPAEAPAEEAVSEVGSIVMPMEGFAACPIGTCDCSPGTAKGAIADVASYLGVDQIWASGFRGDRDRRRHRRRRHHARSGGRSRPGRPGPRSSAASSAAGRRPTGAPRPPPGATTAT